MEFSEKGLAEEARVSALRGLVRPLAPPGGSEVERWFELASELDGDPSQWTQAVDAYQRVTTLAPDHGAAWNNLGLLQHRMGRHEDARRHYEVALAAEPTLAEAAYNLGSLYDDLGNVAAGDPLVPARARDPGRLRRRPLQPGVRARAGGGRKDGAAPLGHIPRARPRQPLGGDRPGTG